MPLRTFQDVIDLMPQYMKALTTCEPIRMYTPEERRALRNNLPGDAGIYVLYEQTRPMYVGRSDNLKQRLLDHGLSSGGSETATFAFNLARENLPETNQLTRRELIQDSWFRSSFEASADRVKQMTVRAVVIEDAIEQTIFEVYVAMTLGTPYNSFENH